MTQTVVDETRAGHEVVALDTIKQVERPAWNGVVDRTAESSLFHRYEWLRAVENGLPYTPRHLLVRKDGNVIGVFPNFVRKLPHTPFYRLSSVYPGYGGPLLPTDTRETLPLTVKAVRELCTGRSIVHEIRACDNRYLRYHTAFQAHGYRPYRGECRFTLDLTKSYEETLDAMSNSRRKAIRRGKDQEYEIVEEELTPENVKRFHRVYRRVMERVDGEVHPSAFFEELLELRERLLLITIRVDGEYAGGMIELLNDEQSTIYGFKLAVPSEYFSHQASELLHDHIIGWGIESEYETYDFGRADPDFEDGLFMFKAGFGGEVVPTLIWERGCNFLWPPVRVGRRKYLSTGWTEEGLFERAMRRFGNG